MSNTDSGLNRAIQYAGLEETDDRGLMPLDQARRIVTGAAAFRRGAGHRVEDRVVYQGDVLWAALLSLTDAREFVCHARRLRWSAGPRKSLKGSLSERYGTGILPWVADHVDDQGSFTNRPSCLLPVLQASGSRKAFELVLAIRRVDGESAEALRLFWAWFKQHERRAIPLLADRAAEGDRRARMWLRHLADRAPDRIRDHLTEQRDAEMAGALFQRLCVVDDLTEFAVLSTLDLAAERELDSTTTSWPLFNVQTPGAPLYHTMRLVAARSRRGVAWGIVFERIVGSSPETASVEIYRYGSLVSSGQSLEHGRPLDFEVVRESNAENRIEGVVVNGPAGKLTLTDDLVSRHGLKTTGLRCRDPEQARFVLRLRAYLSRFPEAFWIEPQRAAAPLELGPDYDVIVATNRFTHVLGTDAREVPARDKFWLAKPSDTRVFRSLARALVERDASGFRPGKSNIDWL